MVARVLTNQREGKRYLAALAFSDEVIVEAIETEMKVSRSWAEDLFRDVKLFLLLCAVYKTSYCAPPRLDRAWHVFVSFTQEYEEFCRTCLGGFVHHRPHREPPPLNGLVRTYGAAKGLFGELSQKWLPREAEPSSCSGLFVRRAAY